MTLTKKRQAILSISILLLLIAFYWITHGVNVQKQMAPNPLPERAASLIQRVSSETSRSTANSLIYFENKGQFNSKHNIRYMVEANGVTCFLKPDGIMYSFAGAATKEEQNRPGAEQAPGRPEISLLTMSWKGANPDVKIHAEEQALEVRNYYTTGTAEGITGVKSFKKIIYEDIYKNIDLIFYSQTHTLKYDFVVKPGGNVKDIQLSYSGNEDLLLNDKGELVIEGKLGSLKEGKPYTYQAFNGREEEIASQYQINGRTVSFEVGKYDLSRELIIDPTLLWATYYGGYESEDGNAVCTDNLGNVYIAGKTSSPNSIALHTGYDTGINGESDAFLVKFNAAGNRLWATYYGGNGREAGQAVCTDPSGNVYMAGYTESISDIAYLGHDNVYNEDGAQFSNTFGKDAFLVKFSQNGQRVWGTYYGGEENRIDVATGVCSDANGNIFLTGYTNSSTAIAHNGYDNTYGGSYDAFLVKFSNGGARQWPPILEKQNMTRRMPLVPIHGAIYIAGYTRSSDLVSGGHDGVYAGKKDAFLAMFGNNGNLFWSTYYGGSEYDEANSVATDASGNVYLAGVTESPSSISHQAHDATLNGSHDAFLVKFNFLGTRLWGTYYGGPSLEIRSSVCVSKNGDIYLAGSTISETGIATNNGYDLTRNAWDGYLVRFNSSEQRQWGTYYGGETAESINGVTTDPSANVYIVGHSISEEGIAHNGFQNNKDESYDAFLAKFNSYNTGSISGGPGDYTDENRPVNGVTIPIGGGTTRNCRLSGEAATTPAKVTVYPNPATEILQIQIGNSSDPTAYIEVFTMAGQKMYDASLNQSSTLTIDVRKWSKGTYILKTHTFSGVSSEKVLIQ